MPNVAEANHVAVALLAHFYESSAAADLCYEAHIGRETCRPLAQRRESRCRSPRGEGDDAPRRRERRLHHRVGDQRRDGRRPARAHDLGDASSSSRRATTPFRWRRAPRRAIASLRYGENPWGRDHLEGYEIEGPLQSRSMQVGGLAMHWGGVTPRFSPEDFKQRTLYGVGTDWPIDYDELDPFYQEAEEVMGVAGEQGPHDLDPRQKPFPHAGDSRSRTISSLLKAWAAKAGIAMWSQPSAKNSIAYRGRAAVLSQRHLLADLPDRREVLARLHLERAARDEADRARCRERSCGSSCSSDGGKTHLARRRVERRPARHAGRVAREDVRRRGGLRVERRTCCCSRRRAARRTAWRTNRGSSASTSPDIATCGGYVDLPLRLYPGMNEQHSLVTKQFMRTRPGTRFIRHDLRDLGIVGRQGGTARRRLAARCCSATRFSTTGASGRRRARRAFARTTT